MGGENGFNADRQDEAMCVLSCLHLLEPLVRAWVCLKSHGLKGISKGKQWRIGRAEIWLKPFLCSFLCAGSLCCRSVASILKATASQHVHRCKQLWSTPGVVGSRHGAYFKSAQDSLRQSPTIICST